MLDLIYKGEADLEEEIKDSFIKLQIDIELFGVTKNTVEKHNNSNKRKVCKYWNRGFCKHDNCPFAHDIEDCQKHIDGQHCNETICHKRHRKTCRYWNHKGCERKGQCAYLHSETYESRKIYKITNKDKSHDIRTDAAETKTEGNDSISICKLCEEGFNGNSEMREHFLAEHMNDLNVSTTLEDCCFVFCMDINPNKCSKFCYFYRNLT